jgi:LPXTG-site transpeptidase (sortase) family protein
MDSHSSETTTHTARRHYARVMAFAVCGALIGGLLLYYIPAKKTVFAPTPEEVGVEEVTPVSQYARSEPVRLVIPKINLDTTFVAPLGLNPDKTVSVPDSYTEVGWYTYGATPGEIGPAVILGHVDSYEGAAVFYHLGQLEEGDEVVVTRADGTVVTFVVESKERVPQSDFPTEKVYGKVAYAGLRLVTCTGVFNKGKQEYSHNLIVYARLKD